MYTVYGSITATTVLNHLVIFPENVMSSIGCFCLANRYHMFLGIMRHTFNANADGEIILKIGQYLAKLGA